MEKTEEKIIINNSFVKGLEDGIPIGLGYLSVAFTFGMMAVTQGLPAWSAGTYLHDKSDLCGAVCRTGFDCAWRALCGDGPYPADH